MWCSSENGVKMNDAFDAVSPNFGANLDEVTIKYGRGYSISEL